MPYRAAVFVTVFATLLTGAGAACLHAAEPWRPLFNGRDLTGWEVVGPQTGGWQVVDGQLQTAGTGGWLSTVDEFDNFELQLEFLVPEGSNSGLFFRAPRQGQSSRQGIEIQLIDDHTKVFGPLEPWQLSGSLYHVVAARPGGFTKAGQWQTLMLRAEGPHVQVHLNGQCVVDTQLDQFPQLEDEHPGLKRTRGYLGLQNYGGRPVAFRNLVWRPLSPETPNAETR